MNLKLFMGKKDRDLLHFLELLLKLEVVEAIGVARLIGVNLMIEELDLEDEEVAEKVLNHICQNFVNLGRRKRNEIIKIMEIAVELKEE